MPFHMSDVLVALIPWALTVLTAAVAWFWKVRKEFLLFKRDWYGEPARPGVAAIPGINEKIANIQSELQRNGGGSVKDAVHRIEDTVDQLRKDFDNHLNSGSA